MGLLGFLAFASCDINCNYELRIDLMVLVLILSLKSYLKPKISPMNEKLW